MRKVLTQNNLSQRSATKTLLAVSFSLSLAALACTTNHTPGNGTPTRSGPEVRTAPTSGITSSSESAPALPPPMTSSSRGFDALPVNNGMSTSDNAAATMAAHQRVRVLGPVSPGASASGGAIPVAGAQFNNPALITNPQVTVNSTISSTPTGVITSGTGGSGGVVSGTTSNVAINGVTNNATVTGVTGTNTSGLVLGGNVTEAGAAIFTPATTAVTATPTASAIAVTPGQYGVAPSPTIASGAVIPPTAATSGTLGVLNTTGTTTVTAPVATTATTTGSANVTAAASVGGTATANARIARMRSAGTTTTKSTATSTSNASSVRVLNANGRVTVTNVKPQR